MSTKILLRSATALALAAALVGCRSQRNTACAPQCAPSPCPPPCSTPVYTPPPCSPPPGMAYAPPAPEAMEIAPPPAPAPADDTMHQALAAERLAREIAEERARQLEDALKLVGTSGGPSVGGGGYGGGAGPATAFAEALRTRTDAEVVQNGNTVLVRFTDAFLPGKADLKPDIRHTTALTVVAESLGRYPGARVGVVGHTDSQKIDKSRKLWSDNVQLSRARAETVAGFLAQKGVERGSLMVDGRGDTEPLVYPERTNADRARNRRVEVVVQF